MDDQQIVDYFTIMDCWQHNESTGHFMGILGSIVSQPG